MDKNYAEAQHPNYSGFVVIGAGLPRTGTMSTRSALGTLLDGACYHMFNVAMGSEEDFQFWESMLEKRSRKEEIRKFFEERGFRSGVDFPVSLFYKELMDAFPEAKIVLTVRNPETWYTSVHGSIYQGYLTTRSFAVNVFMRLIGQKRSQGVVNRISFAPPAHHPKGMFEVVAAGKEESVKFFNEWTEEVKRTVPKDRLLIFEVKEGWQPLCDFLSVPVPSKPFPRVNDTKQILAMISRIKLMSNVLVYGLFPMGLAAMAYLLRTYYSPDILPNLTSRFQGML